MKNVCITYKMVYGNETVQSTITLPMMRYLAEDTVDSIENDFPLPARIENALKALAALHGFTYLGVTAAEIEETPGWRVTWCDHEGNQQEKDFESASDAFTEANGLREQHDSVEVNHIS